MIEAIIFDMDDLMINSNPVHIRLFEKIMNMYGASLRNTENPLTIKEEAGFFGLKIKECFVYLIKKYGLEGRVSADKMNEEFNRLILPAYAEQDIETMPGLFELVDLLRNNKYKFVLASSAPRSKIDIVLRKLGLTNEFYAIVSGEDEIKHGKPAPDIFLKAAEKIGLSPDKCLVLEDAKNGVEAAKAAGMYCIGVHNIFTYKRLGIKQDLSKADLEVNGLNEISVEYIESI